MAAFTDGQGTEWNISIDIGTAGELREGFGLDVQSIFANGNQSSIPTDVFVIGEILWYLVESEATARNISQTDFWKRLNGDALEDGTLALMNAIADFFPRTRRDAIKAGIQKTKDVEKLAAARAMEILESPEFNEKIEAMLINSVAAATSRETAIAPTVA